MVVDDPAEAGTWLTLAPRPGPADLGRSVLPVPGPRLAVLEAAPRLWEPLTPSLVEPVVHDSTTASDLPWRSGAACTSPAMEAWRGRSFDTAWLGLPK